jgi:cell division septum initiation protein DivIVA
MVGVITIKSVGASRRRAGIDFGPEPVSFDEGDLSSEQLEQIKQDPHLVFVEGGLPDIGAAGIDAYKEAGSIISKAESQADDIIKSANARAAAIVEEANKVASMKIEEAEQMKKDADALRPKANKEQPSGDPAKAKTSGK